MRWTALALIALTITFPVVAAAAKPNIIFILSDDLAQGDLGCYGQKLIQTPHLDRMAREGTRFTQAYCGTSVCAPSRASLMTGLHRATARSAPTARCSPRGRSRCRPGTVTVAQMLQDARLRHRLHRQVGHGHVRHHRQPAEGRLRPLLRLQLPAPRPQLLPDATSIATTSAFELPGNDGKGVGKTYAQNLIADEVLDLGRARTRTGRSSSSTPITLPHGRHEIDDLGDLRRTSRGPRSRRTTRRRSRGWTATSAGCWRCCKELKLDEKTLVIVAGRQRLVVRPGLGDRPAVRSDDGRQAARLQARHVRGRAAAGVPGPLAGRGARRAR